MPDDVKHRRRLILDQIISDLAARLYAIMERLRDAIRQENGLPVWELLDEAMRKDITEEANEYCEEIAKDPKVWLRLR